MTAICYRQHSQGRAGGNRATCPTRLLQGGITDTPFSFNCEPSRSKPRRLAVFTATGRSKTAALKRARADAYAHPYIRKKNYSFSPSATSWLPW